MPLLKSQISPFSRLRLAACAGLLCLVGSALPAAEPAHVLNLWPGKAPGEVAELPPEGDAPPQGGKPVQRRQNVSVPTISVYQPPEEKRNGTAVIVCPGGGYNILAWDLEGTEVADWLNSHGVTAIVLKYRVPRRAGLPPHAAPLQDAQRAMGLVRRHAAEWKIDPARVGILGFSAGGNLAAMTSTNYAARTYPAVDDADKLSSRPDFTILIYPAYLEEKGQLVPTVPVTTETPPAFLAHAHDDPISPLSSVVYYTALKQQKIPAELHIVVKGGHGYGLRSDAGPAAEWPARCHDWMKALKLLEPAAAAKSQ